jgi:hypothetical protein
MIGALFSLSKSGLPIQGIANPYLQFIPAGIRQPFALCPFSASVYPKDGKSHRSTNPLFAEPKRIAHDAGRKAANFAVVFWSLCTTHASTSACEQRATR